MPSIAVRKGVLDGLNAQRRYVITYVLDALNLGEPALYTDGTNQFYVWDDARISLDSIARLGALTANWTSIPAGYDPTQDDPETVRHKIKQFVANKIVTPPAPAEGADPFSSALAAQGASAAVQAWVSLPPTMTPVVT